MPEKLTAAQVAAEILDPRRNTGGTWAARRIKEYARQCVERDRERAKTGLPTWSDDEGHYKLTTDIIFPDQIETP